jgi:hypothetical protein
LLFPCPPSLLDRDVEEVDAFRVREELLIRFGEGKII